MKKWTAVFCASLMGLGLLTGCGSSSGTSAEGTTQAAESDRDYIESNGKMIIGYTDYAPMNYVGEDGKLTGFDTELAEAVCEKIGIEAEFVEINWESKETELNSKNIDCIWNGFTISEERKQTFGVTDPYLSNEQVIVMKADREEEIMSTMSGYTFTAEAGSSGEDKILGLMEKDDTVKVDAAEYFADCTYVASDGQAKAIQEVEAGTVDFAVVNVDCATGMLGEGSSYTDLVINDDNEFGMEYFGVAFRKGSDMVDEVNTAINELYADGTVAELAAKYADDGLEAMLLEK